jgi:hypothetical protein
MFEGPFSLVESCIIYGGRPPCDRQLAYIQTLGSGRRLWPDNEDAEITHSRSHARNHTLEITRSKSHTRNHTLEITHSKSHAQNHTLEITHSKSHAQNHTLKITRSKSHTQNHTLKITRLSVTTVVSHDVIIGWMLARDSAGQLLGRSCPLHIGDLACTAQPRFRVFHSPR